MSIANLQSSSLFLTGATVVSELLRASFFCFLALLHVNAPELLKRVRLLNLARQVHGRKRAVEIAFARAPDSTHHKHSDARSPLEEIESISRYR